MSITLGSDPRPWGERGRYIPESFAEQQQRVRADLRAQGGVIQSLVELAEAFRKTTTEVAAAIEGVAWALDRERRGALSAGARQDGKEVAQTIEQLLNDPLLQQGARCSLARRIAAAACAAAGLPDPTGGVS